MATLDSSCPRYDFRYDFSVRFPETLILQGKLRSTAVRVRPKGNSSSSLLGAVRTAPFPIVVRGTVRRPLQQCEPPSSPPSPRSPPYPVAVTPFSAVTICRALRYSDQIIKPEVRDRSTAERLAVVVPVRGVTPVKWLIRHKVGRLCRMQGFSGGDYVLDTYFRIFFDSDMPQTFENFPPPRLLIFGPCPKCGQPMRLALIEPAEPKPGYDKRIYQCISCEHSETRTVKYR